MEGRIRSNPLLAVIDEILRLQDCFEDLFAQVADASSLSTLQKLIIFAVFDSPSPPTVPQIGRNLGHPRQVIQRIVNELVDAGLLEKAPNPHHKKAMLLLPTGKAQELKQQAEERAFETAQAFLASFSADRCSRLSGELSALREALETFMQGKDLPARKDLAASQLPNTPLVLIERLAG